MGLEAQFKKFPRTVSGAVLWQHCVEIEVSQFLQKANCGDQFYRLSSFFTLRALCYFKLELQCIYLSATYIQKWFQHIWILHGRIDVVSIDSW